MSHLVQYMLSFKELESSAGEGMDLLEKDNKQASFSHVHYVDCQQKLWQRLKVDVS